MPGLQHTFSKFLPYGYNKVREGVLCPNCFSLERHRLMWLFLKNETGFFSEKQKVLHIAPEQCFHKKFRAMPNLYYVTADLESPLADVSSTCRVCRLTTEHSTW
jgi:hypothetical protein